MGSMEQADAIATEAIAAAEAAGDMAVRAGAAVTRTYCGVYLRADKTDPDAMRREAEQAFAVFDELDDDAGRTRAIFNIDIAEWASGSADGMGRSAERAIRYARRAGVRPDELECCAGFSWSMCWGTTPASVARRRIDEVVLGAGSDRSLEALAGVFLALLEGMEGQLGQAQDRMKAGRRGLAEVGLHNWVKHTGLLEGQLAMLAADFSLAERVLREVLGMPVGIGGSLVQHVCWSRARSRNACPGPTRRRTGPHGCNRLQADAGRYLHPHQMLRSEGARTRIDRPRGRG
jgi:hypothetical protein